MEPVRLILMPTDFSDSATSALELAARYAEAFDATIELVHVVGSFIVLPPPIEMLPTPAMFPETMDRIADALETAAAPLRKLGLVVNTRTLEGQAPAELVRHAQDIGADLIVMGTHGRTGLAHVVLGSVAEKVIQQATCPVLVVPMRRASS